MPTIKEAIDFASDNGVTVGVDIQGYKGCVKTVKHFAVYKGKQSIRIEQVHKGASAWKHSGNRYGKRSDAIIHAVTLITGAKY